MAETRKLVFIASAALVGCSADVGETTDTLAASCDTEAIELTAAKLIVEHNATAEDTGFQGFVDGEPWKHLELIDTDGKLALTVDARGKLRDTGLTELFFETDEPPNAEVPIADMLARLPAGTYEYRAKAVDGPDERGVVELTHNIPAGAVITAPVNGATVDASQDLTFTWEPVTESVFGGPITITHYELIVNKLDQPTHPGFGSENYDVHFPASITSMPVPHEFLQPGTAYEFEVLAIDAAGNQTTSTGEFTTL